MSTRLEASRRQKIRTGLMLLWVLLFPVSLYYFSPYLPFAALAEGIIPGSLLLFGLLFLGATIFGRLFCGWLCPAGAMLHFAAQARTKAFRRQPWHLLKYILVWFPWAAGLIALALNSDGPFAVDIFYQTEFGISVARPEAYVVYGGILLIFVGLSLGFGRRAACHTICWMAPFMVFGRSLGKALGLPRLHLSARLGLCLLRSLHQGLSDEPRSPGTREGRKGRPLRLHSVRSLRRHLPPEGSELPVQ